MVSNKIFSDLRGIILAAKGNKYDKIPEYTKNLKKIIKLHSCLTSKQTINKNICSKSGLHLLL